MSKDKKNEGKEILEEFKELSEWQKRNQEYLKRKAEEEVALAEEKERKDKLEWEKNLRNQRTSRIRKMKNQTKEKV